MQDIDACQLVMLISADDFNMVLSSSSKTGQTKNLFNYQDLYYRTHVGGSSEISDRAALLL